MDWKVDTGDSLPQDEANAWGVHANSQEPILLNVGSIRNRVSNTTMDKTIHLILG